METRSSADGTFELDLRSYAADVLRFERTDLGTAFLAVGEALPGGSRDVEILMDRSAKLRVSPGLGIFDELEITIEAVIADLLQPRGMQVGGEQIVSWKARMPPGERVELDPLPPNVPLRAAARVGDHVVWRASESIVLQPGESRDVVIETRAGTSIQGRVVDAVGVPASGVSIRLRPASRAGAVFEGARADTSGEIAVTDSLGEYRFANVRPGTWLVGPAVIPPPRSDPRTDPAPVLLPVEVTGGDPVQTHDIVLERGLYVTGRVLAPDDSPVARAGVEGLCDTPTGVQDAITDEAGAFVLGPLATGTWTIRARAFGFSESAHVPVAPGSRDVLLRLRSEAQLEVSATRLDGTPAAGAQVAVMRADGRGELQSATLGHDGKRVFSGLAAAPHHVVITSQDGQIGIARGVEVPVGTSSNLAVHLELATHARVRYVGPGPSATLLVVMDDVLLQATSLTPGQVAIVVSPAGEIDLTVQVRGRAPSRTRIRLSAGDPQEHVYDGGWK